MEGATTKIPQTGQVQRAIDLRVSAAAPVEARRAVAAFPGMGGELGYRALLLTSESVTAAVLAAEDDPCDHIELRAEISHERVRFEVHPVGGAADRVHLVLSSYARRIFQRTASRWGTDDEHRAIWFELAR